eukprot:7320669-Pyramimonas_sp.AAC.2
MGAPALALRIVDLNLVRVQNKKGPKARVAHGLRSTPIMPLQRVRRHEVHDEAKYPTLTITYLFPGFVDPKEPDASFRERLLDFVLGEPEDAGVEENFASRATQQVRELHLGSNLGAGKPGQDAVKRERECARHLLSPIELRRPLFNDGGRGEVDGAPLVYQDGGEPPETGQGLHLCRRRLRWVLEELREEARAPQEPVVRDQGG